MSLVLGAQPYAQTNTSSDELWRVENSQFDDGFKVAADEEIRVEESPISDVMTVFSVSRS